MPTARRDRKGAFQGTHYFHISLFDLNAAVLDLREHDVELVDLRLGRRQEKEIFFLDLLETEPLRALLDV